ncbi:cell wall protein DAN4-like [Maniola jurtina]|uniref:cell wall protein DAN4-like n=1 Tax=Maniola jurtina TaxID=191418 RepID=UPI001E68A8AE|nr:cell wall protein DAN4-like [Maniola jurtina]
MITFLLTLRLTLLMSIACAMSVCKCTTKWPDPINRLAYVDNPVESGFPGHWLPINLIKRIMETRVRTLVPQFDKYTKSSRKDRTRKPLSLSIKVNKKKEKDNVNKVKAKNAKVKIFYTATTILKSSNTETKSKIAKIIPKVIVVETSPRTNRNLIDKVEITTVIPSRSTEISTDLLNTKMSSTKGVNIVESSTIADDTLRRSTKSYSNKLAVPAKQDLTTELATETPIISSSTLSTDTETILEATKQSRITSPESIPLTTTESTSITENSTSMTETTTSSTTEVPTSTTKATTITTESTTSSTESTASTTEPTTSTTESSTITTESTTSTTDSTTSSTESTTSTTESTTSSTESTTSTTKSTTSTTESTPGTTETTTTSTTVLTTLTTPATTTTTDTGNPFY